MKRKFNPMTDIIGKVCLSHKRVRVHIKKEFVRRHHDYSRRVMNFVLESCITLTPDGDKLLYGELRLIDGRPTLDFFAEHDLTLNKTFSMEAK